MLAVGAWAATLIPGAKVSSEIDPKLAHTIKRGNLLVTVTEQGTLESSDNTEIKCKVRGDSTVIWVIEGGTVVKPGDELVRLDTLAIEDAINERTKYALWTRSGAERARADVARAELAIPEYLEGTYESQLMTLEKDLAIRESNLLTEQNMLSHAEMMAERGYVSELEVEERRFAVTRAELSVKVQKTEIDVLRTFTKDMQMETLKGNLNAAKARLAAEEERAKMDAIRRDQALDELQHCVMVGRKEWRGNLPLGRTMEGCTRDRRRCDGAHGPGSASHARPVQDASEGWHSRVYHRPYQAGIGCQGYAARPDAQWQGFLGVAGHQASRLVDRKRREV